MKYRLHKRGGLWQLIQNRKVIGAYEDYAMAIYMLDWRIKRRKNAVQNR